MSQKPWKQVIGDAAAGAGRWGCWRRLVESRVLVCWSQELLGSVKARSHAPVPETGISACTGCYKSVKQPQDLSVQALSSSLMLLQLCLATERLVKR